MVNEIEPGQWAFLNDQVMVERRLHEDECSDAVISLLTSAGLSPDPEGTEDDQVLIVQGAMEIGYLLAIKHLGQPHCGHPRYGDGPHCANLSCHNYVNKHR